MHPIRSKLFYIILVSKDIRTLPNDKKKLLIPHAYNMSFTWALFYGKRPRSFARKEKESLLRMGCTDWVSFVFGLPHTLCSFLYLTEITHSQGPFYIWWGICPASDSLLIEKLGRSEVKGHSLGTLAYHCSLYYYQHARATSSRIRVLHYRHIKSSTCSLFLISLF